MVKKAVVALVVITLSLIFIIGCGGQQMSPVLITRTPVFTPSILSIKSLTPSPPAIKSPTLAPSATSSSTPLKKITPTPTIYSNLSSIQAGTYVLVNVYKQTPYERNEVDLYSKDGIYQYSLAEEGGPVAPGGKKMVVWDSYDSHFQNACSHIRVLDLETRLISTPSTEIPFHECYDFNWSKDENKLYFIADGLNIVEYNLITRNSTTLFSANGNFSNGVADLHISPDGKLLAFSWDYTMNNPNNLGGVYIMDLAYSANPSSCYKAAYLLWAVNWAGAIAWTPDGYLSRVESSSIQILDVNKKKLVNTIQINPGIDIGNYAWSPDKKWIVYNQRSPVVVGIFPSTGEKFTYWDGLISGEVMGWFVVPSP